MKTFGRVLTAMITPFHDDGSVDVEGAIQLANHLLDNGSDGIVVCGTTGESPTISAEDKLTLFREIVSHCGNKGSIIANTGSNQTEQSVAFTKAAAATGVDAVMAVVPYYNKPTQEGLFLHFKAIAEATSLPIIVYNVPGRTGGCILPETIERLHKAYANIAAVKEASGNVQVAAEIYQRLGEDILIYSGDDALTLPMLSVGACGVISVSSHIVGKQMNEMIQSYEQGDVKKAKIINASLQPFHKAMFVTTNPIPVKYAVRHMGLPAGPFRLPLCDPGDTEKVLIEQAVEAYK